MVIEREPSCVLNHEVLRRELTEKEMPAAPCPDCGWLLQPREKIKEPPLPKPPEPVQEAAPASPSEAALPGKPPPKVLTPDQIRRLGALQVEEEQSSGLDQFLLDQRAAYEDKRVSKQDLVEALVSRDRQLALEGRQMADGRFAARLLRETVRGLLHLADHAELRALGDRTKTASIERILQTLGAEPADLRQIKLHGSMLGSGTDMQEKAEQLAKEPPGPSVIDRKDAL